MLLRRLALAAVLLSLLMGAATAPAAERTHDITVADYISVHLITDCVASPDGKHVAFANLRWGDHDKSRYTELWVVSTQTKKSTRLTFDAVSHHSPHWSPDGTHLYFVTTRDRDADGPPYDGTSQVWVLATHPGEPFAVTRVKDGIQQYQLSDDDKTLYYTRDGKDADESWQAMRDKYPDIKFNYGGVTFTELWKLNLETWREERVVAPERVIIGFEVAPDEKRIALLTTPDARLFSREGWSRVDIYDVATGAMTTLPDELYRDKAPSPYGWLETVTWAPDSLALAFTVGFDGYPPMILTAEVGYGNQAPRVWQVQRPNEVHPAGHVEWQPNSRNLCFVGDDHARRRVYCVEDLHDGRQGGNRTLTPGDVVVHDFSFTRDGKQMAAVVSTTEHCRDVFWYATGDSAPQPTRLTHINPQMKTWKLPQIRHITWQAPDGTEVGGILELPPDYDESDGPLPLVLELHGGPTACTLHHFRYWIYGRTIFAARGWALLSPNYRGSTGYGDKFMTDLIGAECDIEVKDIMAGVDAVVERGIADPNRMGVMGWSNGGFLTNCMITSTQRFKAASSGAGGLTQYTQWGLQDTPGHVINYMQGLPWEREEAYAAASPGWRLDEVTTPTLIHTGERDARVVPQNSYMLFRGLREYGDVPVVLLTYPGAGHGLTIADHRVGKLEWDIAWFDHHVLGEENE